MNNQQEDLAQQLHRLIGLSAAMRLAVTRWPTKDEYRQIHLRASVETAKRFVEPGYAGVVFSTYRDSERCVCYNAEQVPVAWLDRLDELAPGSGVLYVFKGRKENGE